MHINLERYCFFDSFAVERKYRGILLGNAKTVMSIIVVALKSSSCPAAFQDFTVSLTMNYFPVCRALKLSVSPSTFTSDIQANCGM